MPDFLTKSLCRGHRPQHLAVRRPYPAPRPHREAFEGASRAPLRRRPRRLRQVGRRRRIRRDRLPFRARVLDRCEKPVLSCATLTPGDSLDASGEGGGALPGGDRGRSALDPRARRAPVGRDGPDARAGLRGPGHVRAGARRLPPAPRPRQAGVRRPAGFPTPRSTSCARRPSANPIRLRAPPRPAGWRRLRGEGPRSASRSSRPPHARSFPPICCCRCLS